ncbi:MAG: DUF3667 domain-containing protein [Gemmatimonadaceae bacterium]
MTGQRDPDDVTVPVHGLPSPATRWNVQCLNCQAELHGHFCSSCGQRVVPPHPTVRELAGDAVDEFTGWDGKFSETLRTLVRRPGELTWQWLEGRRVRYISPVRLYLTASLLYFLVAASVPRGKLDANRISVGGVNITRTDPKSRPGQVAITTSRSLQGEELTAAERDSALARIESAPWLMRPLMRKGVGDPDAVRTGILKWMPRVLFALLPIYAGILALFYRRRHYPEHLYFAIHLHAFVFLALSFSGLVKFAQATLIEAIVSAVIAIWIAVYSILALRRVYGGSLGRNVAKGIGIMILYVAVALPMLVAAVLLSAF